MAEVYLCTDKQGKLLAVKWLTSRHPSSLDRFQQEIQRLRFFHHEHIVPIFDSGEAQGRPFFAMQYIEGFDGISYAQKLQQHPPSERHRKCTLIGKQIACALQYLHQNQCLHRDVKPSNIMIDAQDKAFLIDFGTLKTTDHWTIDRTTSGILIGTPFYAATEQINGEELSYATDQFALGATLYFLLLNKRPFESLDRPESLPAPSFFDPSIPPSLEACILRLMANSPSARFQDMQQVIESLSTKRNSGIPLAGRQNLLSQIGQCISRVHSGEQLLVVMNGHLGSGRKWAADTLYNGAMHKGIDIFEIVDIRSSVIAQQRLGNKQPILLLDRYGKASFPSIRSVSIDIAPLSLANIRRSLYAQAPKTKALSLTSEQLLRWTGGLPRLLIPIFERYTLAQELSLPKEIPTLEEVDTFFADLDWEHLEILATLACSKKPLSTREVETATQIPAATILDELATVGLCEHSIVGWCIANEIFAAEAQQRVPDLDGIVGRLTELPSQTFNLPIEVIIEQITDLRLAGHLSSAQKIARALVQTTRNHSSRSDFCTALIALGEVYLAIGLFAQASAVFADASVLTKAFHLTEERVKSHLFRAQLSLEQYPNRQGGAEAIDRLLPLLSNPSPLLQATWTWAVAHVGDHIRWQQGFRHLQQQLPHLDPILRIRCSFSLLRGAAVLGKTEEALGLIEFIQDDIQPYPLFLWEFGRAAAILSGSPPPPTSHLAYGLAPEEIMLLNKRWIQVKGITPDPTHNH